MGKDSWVYTGTPASGRRFRSTKSSGIAYLPVELPTGDYYGGHRAGQRAVRRKPGRGRPARPGQRKWHYQLVHHGIWDMDYSVRADSGRHHRERPGDQGGGAADRSRRFSMCSIASPASRCGRSRSAGAEGRCARRVVRRRSRSRRKPPAYDRQGVSPNDLDRLHAGAARRGGEAGREIQDRSDVHAAGRQPRSKVRSATLVLPTNTGGTNWPRRCRTIPKRTSLTCRHRPIIDAARAVAAGSEDIGHELRPGLGDDRAFARRWDRAEARAPTRRGRRAARTARRSGGWWRRWRRADGSRAAARSSRHAAGSRRSISTQGNIIVADRARRDARRRSRITRR